MKDQFFPPSLLVPISLRKQPSSRAAAPGGGCTCSPLCSPAGCCKELPRERREWTRALMQSLPEQYWLMKVEMPLLIESLLSILTPWAGQMWHVLKVWWLSSAKAEIGWRSGPPLAKLTLAIARCTLLTKINKHKTNQTKQKQKQNTKHIKWPRPQELMRFISIVLAEVSCFYHELFPFRYFASC